jgi:hypothetical protein
MLELPTSTSPPSPETFLHFTSTAWTAIGSIVSAASLLVLAGFNSLYLRRAHEQSVAARKQADVAQRTLDALQKQMLQAKLTELANAKAIISRCAVELILLCQRLKTENRVNEERMTIVPDDWNAAVVYVSRELPGLQGKIMNAGSRMKAMEGDINQILKTPFNQRGANSSTGQQIQAISVSLNNLSAELNSIICEMK